MATTSLWRRLTAAVLFTIGSLPIHSAPQWVVLDNDMQRDGDRSSLQRHGPWAEFTQRWGGRVAGKEGVIERMESPLDAHTFHHGELGPHLETEWPIEDVRMFRKLQVGEFSPEPHRGVYGWEIYRLQSRRTIPAPTLGAMRSRLNDYVTRARACRWEL